MKENNIKILPEWLIISIVFAIMGFCAKREAIMCAMEVIAVVTAIGGRIIFEIQNQNKEK